MGGDCFDFIALRGDSLGIVVGDVSGKGIPAAIFMALARSLLRAEGSRAASPCEALQNVNRHLFGMNEAEMFVTVLYGVLNGRTREFQFVRAGHEMPIVVDGRGEAVTLPPGRGQPLGIIPEPALDEQKLIILPGSTLLIYTDGATDALDPQGAFFGLERLHEAVRANRQASAQALCDRLLQAVIEHQGVAPQHDDVTPGHRAGAVTHPVIYLRLGVARYSPELRSPGLAGRGAPSGFWSRADRSGSGRRTGG